MNSLFIIVWVMWLLSEVFLNRFFHSKSNQSDGFDKNSLNYIWITITLSITLGMFVSHYLPYKITNSSFANYLGLLLVILGMIIRFTAIYTLGKFFTVDVTIHDNHELVKSGFYKYLRHPSYTGSLLSFFGFALSQNLWISLIVIFVPILISFL